MPWEGNKTYPDEPPTRSRAPKPSAKAEYLKQVAAGRQGPKKKQTTFIMERNGGVHRQKAWRKIRSMLEQHDFKSARLYHLVLMLLEPEVNQGGEVKRYQRALKALCLLLTHAGIRYRWRACVELEDAKGWHMHVFILAEASSKNPCQIINHNPAGATLAMMNSHGVKYHHAKPEGAIHRVGGTPAGYQQNYASIAGAEKLDDCIDWLSYIAKARSKPDDTHQIYFSSRDSIRKKDAKPKVTSKARTPRTVTAMQSAIVTEHDAPRATILDAIEIEASIDAISAPAFFLEPDAIAIEIDPAIATSIERPTPAAIDPRQCDLFNQPAIVLGDSDQPAPAVGKNGRRVSDERRATVMAILLDPERGQWSDRAISRETGVSAPIIRVMRATLTPNDGQIRTFQKGGKIYTMNAAAIGKRPPAPPTTQG
jgi:hypothetical protein